MIEVIKIPDNVQGMACIYIYVLYFNSDCPFDATQPPFTQLISRFGQVYRYYDSICIPGFVLASLSGGGLFLSLVRQFFPNCDGPGNPSRHKSKITTTPSSYICWQQSTLYFRAEILFIGGMGWLSLVDSIQRWTADLGRLSLGLFILLLFVVLYYSLPCMRQVAPTFFLSSVRSTSRNYSYTQQYVCSLGAYHYTQENRLTNLNMARQSGNPYASILGRCITAGQDFQG